MTNLLNTKTLLVIAALLASIVGLLIRQEQRSAHEAQQKAHLALQEQQRKAEQQRQEKERWDRVRKYQDDPASSLQGMGHDIKGIDQDFYNKKSHAKK